MDTTVQSIMLTETQARLLVKEINAGITEIGDKIKELYDGEGWKALGYDNWRECCIKEFNFSQTRAYQMLAHAKTIENIVADSTVVEKPAHERQTRELADLEPKDQPKAWKQSQEESGSNQPTSLEVGLAANNFRPIPKDYSLRGKGTKTITRSSEGRQAGPPIDAEFDQDPGRVSISLSEALDTIENLLWVTDQIEWSCFNDFGVVSEMIEKAKDVTSRAGR